MNLQEEWNGRTEDSDDEFLRKIDNALRAAEQREIDALEVAQVYLAKEAPPTVPVVPEVAALEKKLSAQLELQQIEVDL
jgi:hypothetical protein